MFSRRKNLVGQKINMLLILEPIKKENNKKVFWKVLCDCGTIKIMHSTCFTPTRTAYSCGCHSGESRSNKLWKGYEEISSSYWSSLKHGAKLRNFEFDITIEYAWELFLKQNRKCSLSGVDIIFTRNIKHGQTASLDRVDSTKGYIESNIVWVHKDVNILKSNFTNTQLIYWSKLIYQHNQS